MREVLVKNEEFKDSPVGRIPKDWEVYSLEDITQYITYGFTNPMPTTKDGPWMITALDIANGIINYEQARHTSEKAYKNDLTQKSKPQIGDILITKDGTLGRIAVVDRTGICINQSVACLRPLPDTDIKFLLHYLSSGQGQDQMLADAGGSTIKHLYITKIAKMEVPVPPSEERRKIVEILDTVDDAIARTSSLITKLKQTKAGLLQDLLTRGLDEDGTLRDPQAHPEQFKDSPLGQIPKDWDVFKLLEIVPRAEYGISVSLDDEIGIPVLRMNNLKDGELDLTELKKSASFKAANLLLQPFDVLFNRTNSIEHVGRTAIYRGQMEQASFASYLVRLIPEQSKLIPEYLNIWLNLPITQILIRRYATPGVHQVNINPTNLRQVLIALPQKISEQEGIVEKVASNKTRIRTEEAYLNKLKLQKQGLMQDLLTGKVRVKSIK